MSQPKKQFKNTLQYYNNHNKYDDYFIIIIRIIIANVMPVHPLMFFSLSAFFNEK